jgi:NCAIR mutase (PurE)-related protein
MEKALRALLEGVRDGSVPVDDGVVRLRDLAFEDLGFANVDHHRKLRSGGFSRGTATCSSRAPTPAPRKCS